MTLLASYRESLSKCDYNAFAARGEHETLNRSIAVVQGISASLAFAGSNSNPLGRRPDLLHTGCPQVRRPQHGSQSLRENRISSPVFHRAFCGHLRDGLRVSSPYWPCDPNRRHSAADRHLHRNCYDEDARIVQAQPRILVHGQRRTHGFFHVDVAAVPDCRGGRFLVTRLAPRRLNSCRRTEAINGTSESMPKC